MNKKKLLLVSVAILCVCLLIVYNALSINKLSKQYNNENIKANNEHKSTIKKPSKSTNKKTNLTQNVKNQDEENELKTNITEKYINMHNDDFSYNSVPLSGITELSELSPNVTNQIDDIIKTSNSVYFIKKHGNKIFIILDNPENIYHGIDFIEISANNGHQTKTEFGHTDKTIDPNNENWEYDKNFGEERPTKHTVFNKKGKIEYTEEWSYEENPIKYEKKDGEGNIIAIKKETLENGTNLRVENLLYDKDGNTKLNVTAVYENEDLKRFTYYDASNLNNSTSIINEYENGQKVKETLYNSELKVKNIYESDYKDGTRTDITVYDDKNELKIKYLPLSE